MPHTYEERWPTSSPKVSEENNVCKPQIGRESEWSLPRGGLLQIIHTFIPFGFARASTLCYFFVSFDLLQRGSRAEKLAHHGTFGA